MQDPMRLAITAAASGTAITPDHALELARRLPGRFKALLAAASGHVVHEERRGFTCGIINAKSGRCSEDCAFCAQSRYHSTGTPVYPMLSPEKIYAHACRLAEHGVTRMGIVTSGAGPSERDLDMLCETARTIRDHVDIQLCASLGVLTADMAARLGQAGFESYHHNLETARSHYPAICSTHGYDLRCATVREAKKSGLRVCSGGLFGIGESWEQRIELAATLQELRVDCVPVNYLMPVAGTRMGSCQPPAVWEALAIIALFRLMLPSSSIVLCGGRGATLGEWDRLALHAGADGFMVGDYLTEKGSPFQRDMLLLEEWGVGNG